MDVSGLSIFCFLEGKYFLYKPFLEWISLLCKHPRTDLYFWDDMRSKHIAARKESKGLVRVVKRMFHCAILGLCYLMCVFQLFCSQLSLVGQFWEKLANFLDYSIMIADAVTRTEGVDLSAMNGVS